LSRSQLAYLGPPGSFTWEAISLLHEEGERDALPMDGSRRIVEAVENGIVDLGLVPAENSVEGEVVATTDALLAHSTQVLVREEVSLRVTFTAWRRSDDDAKPRIALSHPHALAQCRNFTESLGLETRACASTSSACHEVAESTEKGLVAIAGPSAGEMTGLEAFEQGVEDTKGAQTRFFLLAKAMHPLVLRPEKAPTTVKSLMAVIPPRNRIGVLVDILQPFSERGVDLASLSSRPLRHDIGQYCFLIQAKGSIFEDGLANAVLTLLQKGHRLKFLGSFPSWPAAPARIDHGYGQGTEEAQGLPGFVSIPGQLPHEPEDQGGPATPGSWGPRTSEKNNETTASSSLVQWLRLPVA
jgi:prephenate dehydratase